MASSFKRENGDGADDDDDDMVVLGAVEMERDCDV
jgi:hypothetical protein